MCFPISLLLLGSNVVQSAGCGELVCSLPATCQPRDAEQKGIAKAAILGICGILQSITQLCRQLLVKSKVITVTQMERMIVTVLYICSITLLDSSKLVLSSHHNSHHGSEDKAECEDSRADERLFYLL